jgi:hypothetical protein
MTAVDFGTAAELAKYVNDNAIPQADVAAISFKQGRWFLFHF